MATLHRFNTFIILEKSIILGKTLEDKLKKSNSNLSKLLLDFLKSDKIKDDSLVDEIDYNPDDNKTITVSYTKNNILTTRKFKIGKLLTYLGMDINQINIRELEDLVSHLKQASISNMKEIKGVEILDYYLESSYEPGSNILNTSCMRYEKCQDYLDLYYMNPNQISLLILLNDEMKLRGRAIIWNADDGTRFIDRIYTSNKQYEAEFHMYCEANNIIDSPGYYSRVTLTGNPAKNYDGKGEYSDYPYMDVMKYYNPDTGELDGEIFPGAKYKLDHTDGRKKLL